jgi:hypothetical protein
MADGMYRNNETVVKYYTPSIVILAVLVGIFTLGEIYLTRFIATTVVGMLTSGWAVYVNNFRFLLYSVILSVVCAFVFLLSYVRRTVKVINNERR